MAGMVASEAKNTGNTNYAFCILHVDLNESGKPIDFTFLEANEEMARLEGKTVEELVGHRFFEIFPDDDRNWIELYYKAAYQGESIGFNEISEASGRYLHVQACPAGKEGCCACVFSDIRENLLEQIRLQEEHERAILAVAERTRVIEALSKLYTTIIDTDLRTGASKVIKRADITNSVIGLSLIHI